MILKITSWTLHVFLLNTLLLNFVTIFMIAKIFWCIFTTMTQTTSITNVLVIIKNHLHFITTWFSSEIIDIIFYAFQTKRTVNLSIFIDYFILYFKIAIIVAHIIWWDSFLIYQKMKWDYKIITMKKKKILVILDEITRWIILWILKIRIFQNCNRSYNMMTLFFSYIIK